MRAETRVEGSKERSNQRENPTIIKEREKERGINIESNWKGSNHGNKKILLIVRQTGTILCTFAVQKFKFLLLLNVMPCIK